MFFTMHSFSPCLSFFCFSFSSIWYNVFSLSSINVSLKLTSFFHSVPQCVIVPNIAHFLGPLFSIVHKPSLLLS